MPAITLKEVVAQLKSLGDEKVRALHRKAGAADNVFGVKMGDIRKIAAKIKTDHKLALGLWETGNIDAMLLAILVMKPKELTSEQLDRMVRSVRIAKSPEGLDIPALLDRIERELAKADPAEQWTMNNCLAGIGVHHPKHRKRALAIGEELGVYRDYPVSKGCTSPFAPIWINEMVRREA